METRDKQQREKALARGMEYAIDYRITKSDKIEAIDVAIAYANGIIDGMDGTGMKPQPDEDELDRVSTDFKPIKPVSIHYDENGEPDGVLVQTFDKSFIVTLHDAENGREMTWDEAVDNYGDTSLPNKKEAAIICAYLDEINTALKEAGGEPLDGWYWTGTEYDASYAWLYEGNYGCLSTTHKDHTYSVRPIISSEYGPI